MADEPPPAPAGVSNVSRDADGVSREEGGEGGQGGGECAVLDADEDADGDADPDFNVFTAELRTDVNVMKDDQKYSAS